MTFTDSTSLYFYSAVFQGNMALLALVGVFVIFKLQQISSAIQEKDKIIIEYIQNSFRVLVQEGKHLPSIPINYKDTGDLKNVLSNIIQGNRFNEDIRNKANELLNEDADLDQRFNERDNLQNSKKSVINRIIAPFIMTFFVITLSLILLPLSNTIHTSFTTYEVYPILILIILNIGSLSFTGIYIFSVLKK